MTDLPLSALLSKPLLALGREMTTLPASVEPMPGAAIWFNVLRPLQQLGEVRQRDLPALGRISKRAVRTALTPAQRAGWLEVDDEKRLRLTAAGKAAADGWADRIGEIERRWKKRFGARPLTELRSDLCRLVSQFDLELPHWPQSYGNADTSIVGGVSGQWGRPAARRVRGLPGFTFDIDEALRQAEEFEAQSDGRLHVGRHGNDWRPVARNDDTTASLPLCSLLSQVLVAFTIEYESCGGLALASVANYARFVPDAGIEFQGGDALPVRHGYSTLEQQPGTKLVWLRPTDKGRRVRDAYMPVTASVEQRWRRRYGDDLVSAIRSRMEPIVAKLDPRLPEHAITGHD